MDILEKIADDKRKEVKMKKELIPAETLEILPFFARNCISLSTSLKSKNPGVIAEFKRKSPSKPELNLNADVEEVTSHYEISGASGISILTDEIYFGGTNDDIFLAREQVEIPILRKDFIIDQYQILEAKAIGADVVLLIAALLSRKEIESFSALAQSLGLEVLLEVHNEAELEKSLMPNLDMIGVNNRNLKTFKVDINTSKELSNKIPLEFVKISESGISSIDMINDLKDYGFQGFLMGENFMKTENPGKSAKKFIEKLN